VQVRLDPIFNISRRSESKHMTAREQATSRLLQEQALVFWLASKELKQCATLAPEEMPS